MTEARAIVLGALIGGVFAIGGSVVAQQVTRSQERSTLDTFKTELVVDAIRQTNFIEMLVR